MIAVGCFHECLENKKGKVENKQLYGVSNLLAYHHACHAASQDDELSGAERMIVAYGY